MSSRFLGTRSNGSICQWIKSGCGMCMIGKVMISTMIYSICRRNARQDILTHSSIFNCAETPKSVIKNAILIGKVLELHGLNPKLCHCIYVGVGVPGDQK